MTGEAAKLRTGEGARLDAGCWIKNAGATAAENGARSQAHAKSIFIISRLRRGYKHSEICLRKMCEHYSQSALFFAANSIIMQKITDTSSIKVVRGCWQHTCVCFEKKMA